jgi:hypothetical protein
VVGGGNDIKNFRTHYFIIFLIFSDILATDLMLTCTRINRLNLIFNANSSRISDTIYSVLEFSIKHLPGIYYSELLGVWGVQGTFYFPTFC